MKVKLYKTLLIMIFLIGIFLRVKTYLFQTPLWHDECSLAMSFVKDTPLIKIIKDGLLFNQKAPDLFVITQFFIAKIFGTKELALRIIPFCSGILSIFLFYKISIKIFERKFLTLISNFLFAINYQLIYFSQEFKQYSSDVMFFMIAILYFDWLLKEELTYKKSIVAIFISIIMVLFSFPTAFVIGGYFCTKLIKFNKQNIKQFLTFLIPIFIMGITYYCTRLLNVQVAETTNFIGHWGSGFLNFNPISFLGVLGNALNYFFYPNIFALFGIILFVCGIIYINKQHKNIGNLIFSTLIFVILASLLKIYPIFERVAIYLIPIFIIFITASLSKINLKNKIQNSILILLFIVYFLQYNVPYFSKFNDKTLFQKQGTKTLISTLKNKIKSDDIIVRNQASISDYEYYSNYLKFYNPKYIIVNPQDKGQNAYFKLLNQLPKNNTYWFCYTFDYGHSPNIPYLKEYLKQNGTIITEYENHGSYLVYVKL